MKHRFKSSPDGVVDMWTPGIALPAADRYSRWLASAEVVGLLVACLPIYSWPTLPAVSRACAALPEGVAGESGGASLYREPS